jgi:hypothetical protein
VGPARGAGRRRAPGLRRSRVDSAQRPVVSWTRRWAGRRGRSPEPIRALRPSLTLKPRSRVARITLRPLAWWTGRRIRVGQRRLRRTRRTTGAGWPGRSRRAQRRPRRRAAKPLRVARRRHRRTWSDPGMAGRVNATAGRRVSGHLVGRRRARSLRSRLQLHPSAIQDRSVRHPPHPRTGSAPNRSPLASAGVARSRREPFRVRRPPWPGQPRTLHPLPGIRKSPARLPRPRLRGPMSTVR